MPPTLPSFCARLDGGYVDGQAEDADWSVRLRLDMSQALSLLQAAQSLRGGASKRVLSIR
jgi:hypothetical protein